MSKSFSDILASSGFTTRDASNYTNPREVVDDGLGSGYSSESCGSDRGASARFFGPDEINPQHVQGLSVAMKNDIKTPIKQEVRTNPFTNPKATENPTSVLEATSNRRTSPPPKDFLDQI
jgi:hypothetical protein